MKKKEVLAENNIEKPVKKKYNYTTKMGRPALYSPELVNLVCMRIATNDLSLRKICEMYDDMPAEDTIRLWLWEYRDEFSVLYNKAKEAQMQLAIERADESFGGVERYVDAQGNHRLDPVSLQRETVLMNHKRWCTQKLAPKKFGTKVVLEATDESGQLEELLKLKLELARKNKKEY